MIEVIVNKPYDLNEFERALKRFKKLVKNDGFLQEIQENKYYKKRSQLNHEKDQQRKRHSELEKAKQKLY